MNYPIHNNLNQLPAPTQATQSYCQAAAPSVANTVLEYTSAAMGVLQFVAGVVGCFHSGAVQAGGRYPTGVPVGHDPDAALRNNMAVESAAIFAERARVAAAAAAVNPPAPPAGYAAPLQVVPPAPPAPPVYAQQGTPAVFYTSGGQRII